MTKTARTVALLFGLALTVRLVAFAWTWRPPSTLDAPPEVVHVTPIEDERGYYELAQALAGRAHAQGSCIGWYPRQFTLWRGDSTRRSFRGPVVPLLYEPVAEAAGYVRGMRLISVLLGALGAPLLFLALRNSPLGSRAWWPAAAYALWPPAIYVSVRALSEAPSQALFLGSLAVMAFTSTRAAVGSGALAALSVLARPAALIPAALLAFATGSRKRFLVFVVAFMAVLAPWQIRNWSLHGRPLMTTNTGVTLVGGNSQAALDAEHPGKWVPPERIYANWRDPPDLGMWGWSNLSEEASDRRFAADALRWVGENPGAAAKLCLWKVVRLFDPDPHSEKDDAAQKAWIGWLTFAPVLLLAVIGARAWRQEWPWTLAVLGTVATAVVFYGDTRMRTCADPALLVFAAHGAVSVARRLGARLVD